MKITQAFDQQTGLWKLNHPAFLLFLVRMAWKWARAQGGRWWEPRMWRFMVRVLRERAKVNATE